MEKIKFLLESVQEQQHDFVHRNELQHHRAFRTTPKISRGEQYLGLPYLILDYPRASEEQNIFFIRTMFWWGNFFSSTLHLSGTWKDQYLQRVQSSFGDLSGHAIGIGEDPWVHHFEADNYGSIEKMGVAAFREQCTRQGHLKIARTLPLADFEKAGNKLFENWKLLLRVVGLIA